VNLRRLHSCRRTRDSILDLVLGEKEGAARAALLSQIEACPGCSEHYRSLSGTLSNFDDAIAATSPDEDYWQAFDTRLQNRIVAASPSRKLNVADIKRALRSKVRIPVPLAAGLTITFMAAIIGLATRPRPVKIVEIRVPGEPTERIVEVPVIQEKVVTRKVFVEKKATETVATPVVPAADRNPRMMVASAAENGGSITRANLEGFQPANDMRIRVIRRNDGGEK
jgi:hypothetical protein